MEYKNNKTANRRRYKSRYHSPHSYKAKNAGSGARAPILIGIATFLVLATLVLVFTFGDSIYAFLDGMFSPQMIKPGEATLGVEIATEAEPPTEAKVPTEAPTEAPTVPQSDEFNRLLTAAGLNAADLTGSQMIFVESSGTSAKVYTYEKDSDGVWNARYGALNGFVGTGGVSDNTGPTDETTPKGTYRFEYAMGTNADPGTLFEYNPIYYGMKWVTDPASVNYNRLVDDNTPVDYTTCQELHEYTKSYPYAVVFDYNRNPVDPSKGCARFLHVAQAPTYGGVGISEDSLREILLWLNPDLNPTISIF